MMRRKSLAMSAIFAAVSVPLATPAAAYSITPPWQPQVMWDTWRCEPSLCDDSEAELSLHPQQQATILTGAYWGLKLRKTRQPEATNPPADGVAGASTVDYRITNRYGHTVALVTAHAALPVPATADGQAAAPPQTPQVSMRLRNNTLTVNRIDDAPQAAAVRVDVVAVTADAGRPNYYATQFVAVPAEYEYAPSKGPLNDYCTASPDEFTVSKRRANFRGPCARHDLCYVDVEAPQARRTICNPPFQEDLRTNCQHAAVGGSSYGRALFRRSCYSVAWTYRTAVDSWTRTGIG